MRVSPKSFRESTVRERTNCPSVPLVVMAVVLIASACSAGSAGFHATDTEADPGAVEISTETRFGGDRGFGTFGAVSGAEVLGCSAGSFEEPSLPYGMFRTLTCESGARSGDFVGLAGGGDWGGIFTDDGAAESFVGSILWEPYEDTAMTSAVLDEEFPVAQSDRVVVPDAEASFMIAVLGDDGDDSCERRYRPRRYRTNAERRAPHRQRDQGIHRRGHHAAGQRRTTAARLPLTRSPDGLRPNRQPCVWLAGVGPETPIGEGQGL